MTSAYCAQMVAAYTSAKEQLLTLSASLDGCIASIPVAISYTEKIIVNSQEIDQGKLKKISLSLDSLKQAFETIIGECDAKIAECQAALEAALRAEAEAAAKANTASITAANDGGVRSSVTRQLHMR